MRRITFLVVAPVLALVVACPEKSGTPQGKPPPGEPIAKIGKSALTVEQLQKRLDEQSPFVRARYNDPAKKKEFLDSQVRFEVLASEAYARGYHEDPEVQEQVKKLIVQKLTREEFDGRVKLTDVTDADLKSYFDSHQADYQKPEMVRASHIAIAFGADKNAAKKKAEEAQKKAADKAKLEDRNHFKALVEEYSTDEPTKRAGGDLRYLTAAEVEQRLGTAAKDWLFAGETINEVSPVIEGKDAFHVFKRTGKRKAIVRTFDQVKNQIKNVVFREKRTQAFNTFVEELQKKHGVQVYEDKLDKLKVNAPPPGAGGPMGDGHGHGMPGGDPHGHGMPGGDPHGAHGASPDDDRDDEPAPAPAPGKAP